MRSNLRLLCPPPRRFRPAGRVIATQLVKTPPFLIRRRTKGARADGQRYERKVHEHLFDLFKSEYVAGPWIKYISAGKTLFCQPDALLIDVRSATITIMEIKLRHTADAWWQINHLYHPVVKFLFGDDWRYNSIEIVKWFDPHTKFPQRFEFLDRIATLSDLSKLSPSEFYVYIWGGKAWQR